MDRKLPTILCPSAKHSAYRTGSSAVVVMAGGAGYVIDCEQRRLIRDLGIQIEHCWYQPDFGGVIISGGVYFEAFDATKVLWKSERVSWDGITILDRSTTKVLGKAYDPMSDQWQPFKLNILNGAVGCGSYDAMVVDIARIID